MKKIILLVSSILVLAAGCNSIFTNKSPSTVSQATHADSVSATVSNKTYSNQTYGFSFQYPSTWTDAARSLDIGDYFTAPPQVEVLDVSLSSDSGTFQSMATKELQKNNCPGNTDNPGDHVINITASGALFAEYCSASTESYIYLFKNTKGQVIELSYQDDFDENSTEPQKLTKLNNIISSIKVY